jgi:hypothetical protein
VFGEEKKDETHETKHLMPIRAKFKASVIKKIKKTKFKEVIKVIGIEEKPDHSKIKGKREKKKQKAEEEPPNPIVYTSGPSDSEFDVPLSEIKGKAKLTRITFLWRKGIKRA